MTQIYGPNNRTDSAPMHQNAIRRFREELRMNRPAFAQMLSVNVDTLRVWEDGKSKPRGEAALKIVAAADRNHYPLVITDIFPKKKK